MIWQWHRYSAKWHRAGAWRHQRGGQAAKAIKRRGISNSNGGVKRTACRKRSSTIWRNGVAVCNGEGVISER